MRMACRSRKRGQKAESPNKTQRAEHSCPGRNPYITDYQPSKYAQRHKVPDKHYTSTVTPTAAGNEPPTYPHVDASHIARNILPDAQQQRPHQDHHTAHNHEQEDIRRQWISPVTWLKKMPGTDGNTGKQPGEKRCLAGPGLRFPGTPAVAVVHVHLRFLVALGSACVQLFAFLPIFPAEAICHTPALAITHQSVKKPDRTLLGGPRMIYTNQLLQPSEHAFRF